jgi:ATP-dependent helicase HepA
MWRQVFGQFQSGEIRPCFRFDFLIETQLDDALAVLAQETCVESGLARSSLTRRGDSLFWPTFTEVWLDEEGEELSREFIQLYLAPRYARDGGDGYIDKNLDIEYLNAFKKRSPDLLTNWSERCARLRAKALAVVKSRPEVLGRQSDSLERAMEEDEIRYAQIRTRIQSLEGSEASTEIEQLALEQALNKALHRGISFPSVKVDVAGVVFLTSEPVSLIEGYLRHEE